MPAKKGDIRFTDADAKQLDTIFRDGVDACALLPPWTGIAAVALDAQERSGRTVVIMTDGPLSLERTREDIAALSGVWKGKGRIHTYPALESFPGHGAAPHAQMTGDRLNVLTSLSEHNGRGDLIITSIQAVMQRTVSPEWIRNRHLRILEGDEHETGDLLTRMEQFGYSIEPEVLEPGQVSWRGSILDIWPPGAERPYRIEFFGFTVESIRLFDPLEQRSVASCRDMTILPARETADEENACTLIHHLPVHASYIWADTESIAEHAALYERSAEEASATRHIISYHNVRAQIAGRNPAGQLSFSLTPPPDADAWRFDFEQLPGIPANVDASAPLDHVEEQRRRFLRQLLDRTANGWHLHVFFGTTGSRERFTETMPRDAGLDQGITLHEGNLSESAFCEKRKFILLSDRDLYGRRREQVSRQDKRRRSQRKTRSAGERIHSWSDIQPGDYVVHIDHGIGIYRGLFEIKTQGGMQEVLTVEYADHAKVYIPTGQTHLLSRYIGVGKRHPKLHTVGGKRWTREMAAAERAVEDLAAQLLETQASRDAKPGHAFSRDTVWQHEFEDAFPFEETPDQAQAIHEIKADMENARPMDRLVCGDVGYGKTEVAMRAAFKAVMDSRQVAMLVPTTVLAQQHYDTFCDRMSAFPIRIAMLSRFQTKSQQAETLERLAAGNVDIIIGTHRLVQKDVRFRNLGLVIIDEEQRFGVKHKEYLKHMRQLVDVLTMTATPIPRTLYMSLTGAKDLSIIETAPVERLPIETVITENRDDVVREAILRELNREGQIYYLHNRVQTIEHVRNKLVNLVPEARIRVAHGQMKEGELSSIMRTFTRGDFDLLLCTTIIESGLNIPNVNTILIDRADRFGLAELYQLRGRVGRYRRKAYAYLLLPKHGQLFFMARQRIGAVKRYSSLGSGFKLAMRDLELRGAGNILGAEQSGHIATVGFDLYCQLLQRTVNKLKGEKENPVIDTEVNLDFINLSAEESESNSAAVPTDYIEDETLRVRLYRRFASAASTSDLKRLREELIDRFGSIPEPVNRLFLITKTKIAASGAGIQRVEVDRHKVMMTRNRDFIMVDKKFPRITADETTAKLEQLLKLVRSATKKT